MGDILTMLWERMGVFAAIYALILVIICLDLWSGIRKAKQRGEYRSSQGIKRTVSKIALYFNVLLALSAADCIQMGFFFKYNAESGADIPLLPFMTFVGALILGLVEIKSICESADKKVRADAQEAVKALVAIAKDKDSAAFIDKILKSNKNEADS